MGMLAAVHSNQFVMAACIWSKDITISDEGLCLYPGSELKLQKKGKEKKVEAALNEADSRE